MYRRDLFARERLKGSPLKCHLGFPPRNRGISLSPSPFLFLPIFKKKIFEINSRANEIERSGVFFNCWFHQQPSCRSCSVARWQDNSLSERNEIITSTRKDRVVYLRGGGGEKSRVIVARAFHRALPPFRDTFQGTRNATHRVPVRVLNPSRRY